jgi:hypothetical protein
MRMGQSMKKIELTDIEQLWGFKATTRFAKKFSELNLNYSELTDKDRDEAIIKFIETLDSNLIKAGPHRADDWEKGWGENLKDYDESRDIKDSLPKYFGKIPYIRWKQEWILPEQKDMEYNLLGLLLEYIIDNHFLENDSIYEFGCGTGHNLLRIRNVFQTSYLHGLDWAKSSQGIIKQIALDTSDNLLKATNFDYFNPDTNFELKNNAVVLTVASLEQTGDKFKDFIDYIVTQSPRLVVHIEPMWEPLDPEHLLDNLSIRYFKKRNYLDGLIRYLEEKEQNKEVKIIEIKRTYVGSFFIDGYSIVIWAPAQVSGF